VVNIRKNRQSSLVRVWICPGGEVLDIPAGQSHFSATPADLVAIAKADRRSAAGEWSKWIITNCNRAGYYRGAAINRRLYIEIDRGPAPAADLVRSIARYCRAEGLARGYVIEPMRPRR
jgi:hypothetical protein